MKRSFPSAFDGKREGDVEAEITTPGFEPGLRLYISVKKSGDTVGGQDIGGVFARLEKGAKQDKNRTRPYMGVVAVATPPKGLMYSYEAFRKVRLTDEDRPYAHNCEVWYPGFLYPFISGREPEEVYRAALSKVGDYLPFNSLRFRCECGLLLSSELRELGLVDPRTGKIDPERFQAFVSRKRAFGVRQNSTRTGRERLR